MKLPAQAKLVFKGIIFDVYQWEQEMFDGSRQTFEMLKRPDTTQVLAVQNGKIMVCEEEQPGKPKSYSLFGGRLEPDEVPLVAAKRELLEEAGLESKDWELWRSYTPVVKIDWTLHYFIARDCRQIQPPHLDAGERITVRSLNFDEFIEFVNSVEFRNPEFLVDILKMLGNQKTLTDFQSKLFS